VRFCSPNFALPLRLPLLPFFLFLYSSPSHSPSPPPLPASHLSRPHPSIILAHPLLQLLLYFILFFFLFFPILQVFLSYHPFLLTSSFPLSLRIPNFLHLLFTSHWFGTLTKKKTPPYPSFIFFFFSFFYFTDLLLHITFLVQFQFSFLFYFYLLFDQIKRFTRRENSILGEIYLVLWV
jgi:hypothetical protein